MSIPIRRLLVPMLVCAVVAVTGLVAYAWAAEAAPPFASAQLRLADGTKVGTVRFFDRARSTAVYVTLDVPEGRTAVGAFHGFHVHANNDPANGEGCIADPKADPSTWFVSADGHLKVDAQQHGDHAGDMPPLLLNRNGTASAVFSTDRVKRGDLLGRAVIVHTGADNLGNIPLGSGPDQYTANSQAALVQTRATGNAGNRLACGLIR